MSVLYDYIILTPVGGKHDMEHKLDLFEEAEDARELKSVLAKKSGGDKFSKKKSQEENIRATQQLLEALDPTPQSPPHPVLLLL